MNGNSSYNSGGWNGRDSLGGSNMQSSGNYSAYGASAANVPSYVQQSFLTTYPSAGNVRWQQSGTDWWRASYMDNGQPRNIYYNTNGTSFMVALPVMETQVPQDVQSRISSMYGPDVYDITQVRGVNGTNQYIVRTIQNG